MARTLIDKVAKKLNLTAVVMTKQGIKPINQIVNSNLFDMITKGIINLKYEQLIAGPDFLKDRYTFIGTKAEDWPHYDLVRCIDRNLSLENCFYTQRMKEGALDFRKKQNISVSLLKKRYAEKLDKINRNEVLSVKVFHVYDDIYMLADGKHTLAMARYFSYPKITYKLINNLLFDSYFAWIFSKINNDNNFKRHNDIFKKAYEFRNKSINKLS